MTPAELLSARVFQHRSFFFDLGEYENKRGEVGGKKGGGVFLKSIT